MEGQTGVYLDVAVYQLFWDNLKVTNIYGYGEAAVMGMTWLSAVLFIINAMVRAVQEQAKVMTNQANWTEYLYIVGVTLFLLVVYALIVNTIFTVFLTANNLISGIGFQPLSEKIYQTVEALEKLDENNAWYQNFLDNVAGWVGGGLTWVIYQITFIILLVLYVLFTIGQVMIISFVAFWGLIAIPSLVFKNLSMFSGFAKLAIFSVTWVLVEAFLTFIVTLPFADTLDVILALVQEDTTIIDNAMIADIFLVMALANLVIAAVMIAAPMLTLSLINNHPAVGGLIAPLTGIAGLAGAFAWKQASDRLGIAARTGSSSMKEFFSKGQSTFDPMANMKNPGAAYDPYADKSSFFKPFDPNSPLTKSGSKYVIKPQQTGMSDGVASAAPTAPKMDAKAPDLAGGVKPQTNNSGLKQNAKEPMIPVTESQAYKAVGMDASGLPIVQETDKKTEQSQDGSESTNVQNKKRRKDGVSAGVTGERSELSKKMRRGYFANRGQQKLRGKLKKD